MSGEPKRVITYLGRPLATLTREELIQAIEFMMEDSARMRTEISEAHATASSFMRVLAACRHYRE